MKIISVASGKGGVGKSTLSSNLSIALAQNGKKVCLADLDLGGSNLHLILGHRSPHGIGTFLNNPAMKLSAIVQETRYKNLSFLPGEAELPGAANIKSGSKRRLINQLLKLDTDYLILDLGAGSNFNITDFFLLSGCGILVITPTLISTLNAYLFLKNSVFRVLNGCIRKDSEVFKYMEGLRADGLSLQKVHVPQLLENIQKIDPAVYELYQNKIVHLRPRLVMNMLDNPDEVSRSSKLRISAKEYLGIDIEHLGVLYRDELQGKALQAQLPLLAYKPKSVASQAIYRIADKILEMEYDEDHSLLTETGSDELIDIGFREATAEAEVDYDYRISTLEELLHSGTLTSGDMVETIKTQMMEISQLKKENRFLKKKIQSAAEQGYKF